MQTDTRETLIKTRALLADPTAWVQKSFGNEHTKCFCLVGAVNYSHGRDPADFDSAKDPAIKVLANIIRPRCAQYQYDGVVLSWNDTEGRTHDDVLFLLDQAIAA